MIVAPGKRIAEWFATVVDPKVIDGAAHGIAKTAREAGEGMAAAQTGQVRWYASAIAISGVVLIVLFLAIGGGF